MKIERWKTVAGFPDYQVSDDGRVRRLTAGQGTRPKRVLKPSLDKRGYTRVNIRGEAGKRRWLMVHRLVLEAFVSPCPPGHETDHRNANKTDNRLINLEWVTPKMNRKRAARKDLYERGEDRYNAKLCWWMIPRIGIARKWGMTYRRIGQAFGVSGSCVRCAHRGRTWVHWRPRSRRIVSS